MGQKTILNSKMREIVRLIHKSGGYMSANEIAKKTGMSYVTVKKYIKELVKMGVLNEYDEED